MGALPGDRAHRDPDTGAVDGGVDRAVACDGSRDRLAVGGRSVDYFRVSAVDGSDRLPFSLKVLLENLLRTEDGGVTWKRSA